VMRSGGHRLARTTPAAASNAGAGGRAGSENRIGVVGRG
jgi:hypothetical protein